MKAIRGFTLIEILVSLAIGSVVLLLAVVALKSTGDAYGRNTDGVAAEREARAVLTQVAEDMSKASGGIIDIKQSSDEWRRDSLSFGCLQPRDAQAEDEAVGDLCVVNYYVKDLEIGRETVRCLMRGFRSSGEVIKAVKKESVESLYDEQPEDEPVAFGVLSFEVEGLIGRSEGGWQVWENDQEEFFLGMPEVLRLKLVVARRDLASKLRSPADWDNHPLIGNPDDAEQSKLLEVYEITHAFGHAL